MPGSLPGGRRVALGARQHPARASDKDKKERGQKIVNGRDSGEQGDQDGDRSALRETLQVGISEKLSTS